MADQTKPGWREHVSFEGTQYLLGRKKTCVLTQDVIFEEHDFFQSQPVTNASVFYLRTVLHDWPDSLALNILQHLRDAAQPETRLIIADMVPAHTSPIDPTDLPNACSSAPPPLLSNFGIANALAYELDINVSQSYGSRENGMADVHIVQMMIMFNANERTMSEMCNLVALAGWVVDTVYYESAGYFAHIVAKPI